MRFCMITTFYPPYSFGGDATYVRQLSRGLVERGHDVTVIACTDAYRLKGPELPAAMPPDDDGITVHRLESRFGALSPLVTQQSGRPGLKRAALRQILSAPFDVLNFHNISLIGGPGILALGNAPVRLYTLHEHWLVCATHIFWKNGEKPCDGRTCLSCSIRSGIPPQLWRYTGLRDRALASVDRLLSPSAYTAEQHRQGGVERPISVLPLFSALDPPHDPPTASGLRASFVFVGRVTASKGIERLLRVAATLPEIDLKVIGDGDLLGKLRQTYAQAPNIAFLGKVTQAELVGHYASATAIVFPSLAPETFGLAIVEAAACHTPAIVNKGSGGGAEIVTLTGGGIIYEGDDALAEAMRRLAGNPDRRNVLAAKAFAGYRAHYTRDMHLDRYLRQVDEVMQSKQHRKSGPNDARDH